MSYVTLDHTLYSINYSKYSQVQHCLQLAIMHVIFLHQHRHTATFHSYLVIIIKVKSHPMTILLIQGQAFDTTLNIQIND